MVKDSPDSNLASEIQTEAGPVVQLELKSETQEELIANLFEAGSWNEEDAALVHGALELAQAMHAEDVYKGDPYIMHSLRIANRIVRYMDIKDAATIAAALLHDVVEDHAPDMVDDKSITDPEQLQQAALQVVNTKFGEAVATNVTAVTNAPEQPGQELTYDEKLEKYALKVWEATETFSSWAIKFSDWCENGLGVIHTELPADSEQVAHYKRKYGDRVLNIYASRYRQYRGQLTPKANNYVITQLTLAFQRLVLDVPHRRQEPMDLNPE